MPSMRGSGLWPKPGLAFLALKYAVGSVSIFAWVVELVILSPFIRPYSSLTNRARTGAGRDGKRQPAKRSREDRFEDSIQSEGVPPSPHRVFFKISVAFK